jgi:hypothetical protein
VLQVLLKCRSFTFGSHCIHHMIKHPALGQDTSNTINITNVHFNIIIPSLVISCNWLLSKFPLTKFYMHLFPLLCFKSSSMVKFFNIYRVFQEERSIFWEVIVPAILRKKVYMNTCPIPNGFRDRAI